MQRYSNIRPGQVWLDTEGKRIQAHGGSIFYENGSYYWYGENKEKTDGINGINQWGVRMYESRDLYNWKDLGDIIPPELEDTTSPFSPSRSWKRTDGSGPACLRRTGLPVRIPLCGKA